MTKGWIDKKNALLFISNAVFERELYMFPRNWVLLHHEAIFVLDLQKLKAQRTKWPCKSRQ